jgi:hypothetical protein
LYLAAFFRFFRLASVPPGLHNDEAVNALDILQTIPRFHPIFFELNNGREPLFIYLQAALTALVGLTPFGLRLAAAFGGLLTVAATYRLGCLWFGRRAGFLAGVGLATSFWYVDLSRFGLRASMVPLFFVVGLLFLTGGLRRGDASRFALAGVAFALGLYTYTSARVLPFLVAAIVLWELLRQWRGIVRRIPGLGLTLVVTAVVVSPLAYYFYRHPQFLIERANQVSIFNPDPKIETMPVSFQVNAERTLAMFLLRGDQNPRQNLPGRPVFDLVGAPFFVLGLLVLAWRVGTNLTPRPSPGGEPHPYPSPGPKGTPPGEGRRTDPTPAPPPPMGEGDRRGDDTASADASFASHFGRGRPRAGEGVAACGPDAPDSLTLALSQRERGSERGDGVRGRAVVLATGAAVLAIEPAGWVLLWVGALLALGMLSYESPDFLRLTALAPATYLVWGAGVAAAWGWIETRRIHPRAVASAVGAGLAAVVLLYAGGRTFADYFGNWATRVDVYRGYDTGLTMAARYVQSSVASATPLYVYVDRSPPLLVLAPRTQTARWMQEDSNLLMIPNDASRGAVYVYNGDGSLSGGPPLFFSNASPEGTSRDAAGDVDFLAYRLSPSQLAALWSPAVATDAGFSGAGNVRLVGYSLSQSDVGAEGKVTMTLFWSVGSDTNVAFAPYVHVLDPHDRFWGQDDRLGFAMGGWKAGDRFISRHVWTVPPGAPPLTYHFEVGLASRSPGLEPGSPVALGPPLKLGQVQVTELDRLAAGKPIPSSREPASKDVGDGLEVEGFDLTTAPIKAGDAVPIDLLLHATAAPARDLQLALQLTDSSGKVAATLATRPAYDSSPTNRWPAGAFLRDPRALTVPATLANGQYTLGLQSVDASTGQPIGLATLGSVDVVAPPRDFQLPTVQHPLDAVFAGKIALKGFDLTPSSPAPNGTLHVALYWQDLQTIPVGYTVFTHVLDSSQKIVAQVDNPPQRGAAPTTGWVPGQVIRDAYDLSLPAQLPSGPLTLEVGLYDPATGQRLTLSAGGTGDHVDLSRLTEE